MEYEIGIDLSGNLVMAGHTINGFEIVPNNFPDMVGMINTDSVKVRMYNIVSPTIPTDAKVEMSVKHDHKNDAFLLVSGGWIPCLFVKNNTILLADRNVISEIVSRYKNGEKKNKSPLDSFDRIFLNNKVSVDITAFVIEGNERKIPDNSMIDEQIENVTKSLNSALPKLKVTKYPNGNNYYYSFRDMLSSSIEKRMSFFEKIAPKINKQFTEKSRQLAVKQVFSAAEELKLSKTDIAVILALLRITMVGKKTAAQLVLKDSQIYNEDKSYNAACDLTALELLFNLNRFHIDRKSGYNVSFITKDKGLSLLSSLFSNVEVNGSDGESLSINATIVGTVFGDDEDLIKTYQDWFAGKV
ncbi:hypothetical protein EXT48_08035 [Pseudoalteromonas sp. CO348]|uniref:hypothetical protein n=1 Tax=Pseudoalteromonas sp. CO348 TaxID=1777271 RepID=UPI0010233568|nr:hypothetical protein [Pseudoalteromonas sp. CO348]RZG05476.1 hypothetical protein EXT48_08035 [Pseudoalteromonas sp. CO348]